ncbi:aldo/keto reductase [Tunturiibacter empetritectus]|uniref:Aryl-alcohol dehydrogenase-like predicted oxidoreductase n=2 Tax=Tunturiibacter TaxID=3154218 RepID=A0A852VBL1_9BACT|nr:aldo/keto reductase [Edaphobacter lichenicola]NYF88219.1 aryl-alcohol dehydrogenase-like predicted oxidoreductase [Edaphobacter lichenicola]
MPFTNYRTLGRSGLVVSPIALGTMTFGTARWGMDEAGSSAVFNAYVEAGGNFVDTADVYAGGRSEEMLGGFLAERKLRDQIVVATKAGFAAGQGVHVGGNGAKHLHAALEGSLRRLRTDYVDLFWIHVWDSVTPAEELLESMTALVRAGKIRYWGMSNAPAWYVAKLATLATVRGLPGPIALQYFYSLVNRDLEDEHVPLAKEFGMGVVPWSPLAYGLLTGKYDRATVEAAAPRAGGLPRDAATGNAKRPDGDKRLDGANPFGNSLFTERNWKIVEELKRVAGEAGQSPARMALAWVCGRPGVTSTLMGVSRAEQVTDNGVALDIVLSPEHRAALDAVSAHADPKLYSLFTPAVRQQVVFGGSAVTAWT